MTYARTTTAIIAAAIGLVLVTAASTPYGAAGSSVEPTVVQPIGRLEDVNTDEIIDGVRVLADTQEQTAFVSASLDKFAAAGYELTNTEVRYDENACENAVGFHAFEDGHHVVVLCTNSEWTLLHELGHVWSALYLVGERRTEWLALRGLTSWSDGDWATRGTEHAAEIVAFGLYDTWHTPLSIDDNDFETLLNHFEWLFGMEPLHRADKNGDRASLETTARVTVVTGTEHKPADSLPTAHVEGAVSVPAGFRFPLACGYPRWHSAHGGYGYKDPRDWTHLGVDLYAYEGTPVVSPVHGTVVGAGWSDVSGWSVAVQDRGGHRHMMAHLRRPPFVTVGVRVASGQPVGSVGRSGNAAGGGPHLHYEIRLAGETIDPMTWLRSTTGINVQRAPKHFAATAPPMYAACKARA